MSRNIRFSFLARHSGQGSDGSPGDNDSHGCNCQCRRHSAEASAVNDTDYLMVDFDDNASVTSTDEPHDINQPDFDPDDISLQTDATHRRPGLTRAITAPPGLGQDQTAQEDVEVLEMLRQQERRPQSSSHLSMQSLLNGHDEVEDISPSDSMIVEVPSRSPTGSMNSSMCLSFAGSKSSSGSSRHTISSTSSSMLFGVGAHFEQFEQPTMFIFMPLALAAYPQECLPLRNLARSLSFPCLNIDKVMKQIDDGE